MALRKRPRSRQPHTKRPRLLLEALEDRTVPDTYTVTGDIFDRAWNRLDAAIFSANTHPGPDAIVFNIQPDQLRLVAEGQLSPITDELTIDATTQPGYAGKPLVELDGSQAGSGVSGLVIQGAKVTVRGLDIHSFSGHGIVISGGPGGCVIEGNYIGTNVAGTQPLANTLSGVNIFNSPGNTIGGTSPAARNVISGNIQDGVTIAGGLATGNIIEGNYIGTDASGMNDLGNVRNGVLITSQDNPAFPTGAASNNTIGGDTIGSGNVISGNDRDGVQIGFGGTGNKVQGNLIGTKVNGFEALANGRHGVGIFDSPGNTVGGPAETTGLPPGNVISGNVGHGVYIGIGANKGGSTGNQVLGNIIGLDETGSERVPNELDGVRIESAAKNTVGGKAGGAGNVISANTKNGVVITGGDAKDNHIEGNRIGTDAAGLEDLGNKEYGVLVRDKASDNKVGGPDAGTGNTIAFNGSALGFKGHGVVVESGTGNAIRRNSIFFNSGRGIDLVNAAAPDTFTLNDTAVLKRDGTLKAPPDKDDGANGLQNYPAVVSVQKKPEGRLITWELSSAPKSKFTIDFFANSQPDPSGFGEGEKYLGPDSVTTDAMGHVIFYKTVVDSDRYISATATDAKGNTSEFSLVDTDADGLADAWETRGIDVDDDGVVDLKLGGSGDPQPADPERKDVFVEVDAMEGLAPTQFDLDKVVRAFARAPVENPNGTRGITLHARLDETMPRQAWTFDLNGNGKDAIGSDLDADGNADVNEDVNGNGVLDPGEDIDGDGKLDLVNETTDAAGNLIPGDPADQEGFPFFYYVKNHGIIGFGGTVGGFGTPQERDNPLTLAAKRLAYRYCIFADQFAVPRPGGGTDLSVSGNSEGGGNDFMVTLGNWANTSDQRAATFMHELGHTLGLLHGGGDSDNYKPNYHSVMNYTWQMPKTWMYEDANQNGIRDPGEFDINGDGAFGDTTWFLDYSERALLC